MTSRALQGLAVLLLCQSSGELLARGLGLRLPGPVLGLLLLLALLAALQAVGRLQPLATAVDDVATPLLAHLSLLFVPVGVGVVTHLPELAAAAAPLALALGASTLIGVAVTALVLRACLGANEPLDDKPPPAIPPAPLAPR